jgi:hypothetical protein
MKMTTQNWGEVMLSKDALRKICQITHNLTPEDRMAVVAQLCAESKDDEELEMLTRPSVWPGVSSPESGGAPGARINRPARAA